MAHTSQQNPSQVCVGEGSVNIHKVDSIADKAKQTVFVRSATRCLDG
jgi:hypothetical protein